jgi:hypothetical protein
MDEAGARNILLKTSFFKVKKHPYPFKVDFVCTFLLIFFLLLFLILLLFLSLFLKLEAKASLKDDNSIMIAIRFHDSEISI